MTSQLLRFRCRILSYQQQKNTENGAAVTSDRSFLDLFRDDFNMKQLLSGSEHGTVLNGIRDTTKFFAKNVLIISNKKLPHLKGIGLASKLLLGE